MRNCLERTPYVFILLSFLMFMSCDDNKDTYVYPDEKYGVFILNTEGGDLGRLIARYDIIYYPYIGVEGVLEFEDFGMLKYFQKTLMYLNLEKADIRSHDSDSTGYIEANTLHQRHLSNIGATPFPWLKTVILPRKLKAIGEKAFYGSTVSELTMYNNLKKIEANAFENCAQLSEINFPKSLTEIGENAFKGCVSLADVILPAGVKEMYVNTFDARFVKTLQIQSSTPPTLKSSTQSVAKSSSNSASMPKIYVPKGAKSNYESHPDWCNYQILEK
ncbi:leucine-rich repeat domain-containing protein [Dysgonomonas massiliensis]|uniref:leucine-rich repeat domain-containing protein n=1 Tax=Dysgonomonas massiliensis TaxID=2040292 RepID=UPI000C771006|nr:leucine-rich repeat domain-containing protein [Dysgonomonas massiliensis]